MLEIFENRIIISGLIAYLLAQATKVLLEVKKNKKTSFKRIFGSGNMPSSHSSFVSGITTAIGLVEGFNTTYFIISLMVSLVVMYDAVNVRKDVEEHAELLNRIVKKLELEDKVEYKPLEEHVGHTKPEMIAGALLGVITAIVIIKLI